MASDNKKKVAAAGGGTLVAALAAAPALIMTVAVIMTLIMAIVVSTVSGGLGSMFGDKNIQQQYGLFGCATQPGAGGAAGAPILGSQQSVVLATIGVAKTMGLSQHAAIIAIATAMQESTLGADPTSKTVNGDGDTGPYQQRALPGWYADFATVQENTQQLNDAAYAAATFLGGHTVKKAYPGGAGPVGYHIPGLLDVSGWETMSVTAAAQAVQRSAFPDAYAKHEPKATALVQASWNSAPSIPLPAGTGGGKVSTTGGGAATTTVTSGGGAAGASSSTGKMTWPLKAGTYVDQNNYGGRVYAGVSEHHGGDDLSAPLGTPIYAPADGVVAASGPVDAGYANWVVIDHTIDGKKYSTLYAHMPLSSITVKKGDTVKQGQQIAVVGSEGKSSGPHLHWEIWEGGRFDGGHDVNPGIFMKSDHATSGVLGGSTGDCQQGGGATGITLSATGTVAAVLSAGKPWVDKKLPYSWGGGSLDGPSEGFAQGAGIIGFDCSSLVRYMVYQGTGKTMELPRVAQDQYAATAGNPVPVSQLQPGDLMFWGTAGNIHHVAMYWGDGQMIEEPRTGGHAQIVPARTSGDYFGATRINFNNKA